MDEWWPLSNHNFKPFILSLITASRAASQNCQPTHVIYFHPSRPPCPEQQSLRFSWCQLLSYSNQLLMSLAEIQLSLFIQVSCNVLIQGMLHVWVFQISYPAVLFYRNTMCSLSNVYNYLFPLLNSLDRDKHWLFTPLLLFCRPHGALHSRRHHWSYFCSFLHWWRHFCSCVFVNAMPSILL